jgi:hypothetical protein
MHRAPVFALIIAITLSQPILAQSNSSLIPAKTSATSATSDWMTAIQQRHQQLIDRNGPGTDAALRDQLLEMRDSDQQVRNSIINPSTAPGQKQDIMQKLQETDLELTSQLKQIVSQKGWPTIALVGIDASDAAMLIMIHSSDHDWQRQLLPQLEQFADAGSIDASRLALLIDKELVSEGKLQRYGTQFKLLNGGMAMYAVEDPGNLDQDRAKALLPPMQVYKEQMEKMYHLKATNAIVSAAPQ